MPQFESHVAALTHRRPVSGLTSGQIEFMLQLAYMIPIEIVSELIALRERDIEATLLLFWGAANRDASQFGLSSKRYLRAH